jgi:hypothetical protein
MHNTLAPRIKHLNIGKFNNPVSNRGRLINNNAIINLVLNLSLDQVRANMSANKGAMSTYE